jgi:hypothetical protein
VARVAFMLWYILPLAKGNRSSPIPNLCHVPVVCHDLCQANPCVIYTFPILAHMEQVIL